MCGSLSSTRPHLGEDREDSGTGLLFFFCGKVLTPGCGGVLALAAAAVGCQRVAAGGARAVEAARRVVAAVGADVTSSGQSALVNICRRHRVRGVYLTD